MTTLSVLARFGVVVTISDVAKQVGVSIKTVSRVINREESVAENTRETVLAAIDELGFVPNPWAQRLRRGHSGLIALLFHDASASYLMDVINGLMDCGNTYHYVVNLHRVDTSKPEQVNRILMMAEQKQFEGIVITPPCDNSEELVNGLYEMKFPFVQLTPREHKAGHTWVSAADEQGAYEVVEYLLGLGHKRIGCIQGNIAHQASWDRLNGYKKAMRKAGLEIDESLVRQGSWAFSSGLREGRSLLEAEKPPSAILAGNDEAAAGVLQAAWELGIQCPEELSVVGFDDVPLAYQVTPPLTTIRQPIFKIAQKAMSVLIEQLIVDVDQEVSIQVPTELVVRNSTGRYIPE